MKTIAQVSILFLLISFIGTLPVSAQSQRSFDFEVTPLFPEPGDTVTVFAETYSFDTSRANTIWRVNGEVIEQGRGIQQITFDLGTFQNNARVSFTATQGAETISHNITIVPNIIDLIVESGTYTPPFYKGGTVPTHEAPMRIVALPSLGAYDSEELIYTWRINGQVAGSKSGAGRSTLTTEAAPLGQRLAVRVDVESVDGAAQGRKEVSIKTQRPNVVLYAVNPLLGLNTARILERESELAEEEVTIHAEPFYVSGAYRDLLPILYTWKLNGKKVETTNNDTGTITLRQAGTGKGTAYIQVSITHPDEVLVQGGDAASFTFGTDTSGLFNF